MTPAEVFADLSPYSGGGSAKTIDGAHARMSVTLPLSRQRRSVLDAALPIVSAHDPDDAGAGLSWGYPVALLSTVDPVAELCRNPLTHLVAFVDVNFHDLHFRQPLEGRCGQCPSGSSRVAA